MATIGAYNTLMVVKLVEFGLYLNGEELGEILLPIKQVPANCQLGDWLDVFLYHDTENRLIATTHRPHALVGEVGYLTVASVNNVGAFLDWGIPKNLFVPFAEQLKPMKQGFTYLVYVYMDSASKRITGSSKIKKFLGKEPFDPVLGQEVDLIIAGQTEAGYRAIINHTAWGFLFHSDIFQKISEGTHVKGYIKSIREDGKFDLVLQKPGYERVSTVTEQILATLKRNNGFLALTDKSPPEQIKLLFGISKKAFKMAIGALYKERRIRLDEKGITLLPPPP